MGAVSLARIVAGALAGVLAMAASFDVAAAQEADLFRLDLVDGSHVESETLAWDAGGLRIFRDGTEVSLSADDVWRVSTGRPAAKSRTEPMMWLVNGDRLVGRPGRATEVAWRLTPTRDGRPPFEVPLEWLAAVIFSSPADPAEQAVLLRRLRDRSGGIDSVFLVNGDVVNGQFASADEKQVELASEGGRHELETSSIRALALDPELALRPESPERFTLLRLVNGSWMTVSDVRTVARGEFAATTAFGGEIEFSAAEFVEILHVGPRATLLRLDSVDDVEHQAGIGNPPPPCSNASARGGFLNGSGGGYPLGIGTAGGARLTWRLPDQAQRLRTRARLSDSVAAAPGVTVAIAADGERIAQAELSSAQREEFLEVEIPAEADRISLIVDADGILGYGAEVDWLAPIILKGAAE